jgi:hypothetical protein
MDADMETDLGQDMQPDDTTAPTVSISSGMSADAQGNYRLEGSFMDDRGVTSLSYAIDGGAAVPIDPIMSPFGVDVVLTADATITVTAADAAGNMGSASVAVTIPAPGALVADFTVSPLPSTFLPTAFDASGSMDPQNAQLSYAWDFGDGSTAQGLKVGHLYREAGTFMVKLTVSAQDGRMAELTREVTVQDPTPAGMANLTISVLDDTGAPVRGVVVSNRLGQALGTTDAEGRVSIMAGTGTPLVYKLQRDDYTKQILRTEIPAGASSASASVFMTPRSLPVFLLDPAAGGTVTGPNNSRIEFAPDSLVDDETGMPVTGPVAITITPLNHATSQTRAFPGRFEAALPDGSVAPLVSYGLMEVTMSQNGRKVQLAPGKLATIEIPYTVPQGQAGTMLPFWSLDERTGLWILEQAAAPIQPATGGSALVQRVTTSHFSWFNTDAVPTLPAHTATINFVHNNTPVLDTIELDLDLSDCTSPARTKVDNIPVGNGSLQQQLFSNCSMRINAVTTDGRYFANSTLPTGNGSLPIRVEMIDAQGLTLLAPNTPVTGSLQAGQKLYYAFDAAPGQHYAIRLRSADGTTLNGLASLLSPTRIPRPPQSFDASRTSALRVATVDQGLWVVEVSAASGTGSFTIELVPETYALLNDMPTQSFALATGASRDMFVRASRADLARILATGGNSLFLSILDGREMPVFNSGAAANDTGLVRFPTGGFFLVRVTNNGPMANVTVNYAAAAPPLVVVPNPRISLNRTLPPGKVEVFIVPHRNEAAVAARIDAGANNIAPQLSLHSSAEGDFPNPSLSNRQHRSPAGDEAVAAMRLTAVTNESSNAAFIYVSTQDPTAPSTYSLDIDLVPRAAAITAGTCPGATTPSLFAAALALDNDGTLTACDQDHPIFAGLRFPRPRFTLRGTSTANTILRPWNNTIVAVSTGIYGANDILGTTAATIEDLTILNTNIGIQITTNPGSTVTAQRLNIHSPQPLVRPGFTTTCLTLNASPDTMSAVTFADSSCTNVQEGVNITGCDTVSVSGSTFNTSMRGVSLNNIKTILISQNTFTGSAQAIFSQSQRGGATIEDNTITQTSATGAIALSLTLRNNSAVNPPPTFISGNTLTLQGNTSVGIAVGYGAANGDITLDGNKIVGNNGSQQVAIRVGATAQNVNKGGTVTIQNNILRDVGLHAIHVFETDTLTALRLFNNTIRATSIDGVGEVLVNLSTRANNGVSTVTIFNNIFVGGSANLPSAVAYTNSLAITRDYNLFFQAGTPYRPSGIGLPPGESAHDIINQNPSFAENDNLTLGNASPAIDRGTSTGGVPMFDYNGVMRPQGAAHDIGAHER